MQGPTASDLLASYSVGTGPMGTVLLHGFLGSGKNLRSLATKWAAREPQQTFFVPDLLGHGESPPLAGSTTMDDVARAVMETAAHQGVPFPLRIVGHSLGGRVALACARVAAEQVADVVLLDIGPGPINTETSETRRVLELLLQAPDQAQDRRTLHGFFTDHGLSPALTDWILMNVRPAAAGYSWRIDREGLNRLHTTFTSDNLWPVVQSQLVPIHVALGERSTYVPQADAERMRALGCDVHVLPGAGHYVHVDALGPLLDWLVQLP